MYMYMYDHHVQVHSIHLAPRGLHSSVQVHQSQSKVRQTRKDNKDMKSLSFPTCTCSYSSQQVVRRILGCGYARNEYVTDSLCSWASPTSQQFLLDIVYGCYTQTTKLGCEFGGLASAFGSWLVSHWLCSALYSSTLGDWFTQQIKILWRQEEQNAKEDAWVEIKVDDSSVRRICDSEQL